MSIANMYNYNREYAEMKSPQAIWIRKQTRTRSWSMTQSQQLMIDPWPVTANGTAGCRSRAWLGESVSRVFRRLLSSPCRGENLWSPLPTIHHGNSIVLNNVNILSDQTVSSAGIKVKGAATEALSTNCQESKRGCGRIQFGNPSSDAARDWQD